MIRSENNDSLLMRFSPFFCGSLAGMIEVMINHPMWVLKTLSQTRGTAQVTTPGGKKITFKSLLDPRLLYSGALANAFSMIPITALRIGVNQTLKNGLVRDINNPTFLENLSFASGAGVSVSFVCGPVDLINTMKYKLKKLAIQLPEQKIKTGFIDAALYLIKQNGINCLSYGFAATMSREIIYTPFFFLMTPYLKSKASPYTKNDIQTTIAAGTATGIIAATVTQPIDTIKTHQQDIQLNQTTKPDNWMKTATKIYQEGGLLNFFRGGFWRMSRVASAITIMTHVVDRTTKEFSKYA